LEVDPEGDAAEGAHQYKIGIGLVVEAIGDAGLLRGAYAGIDGYAVDTEIL
jgi:hypothetical protein